MGSRQHGTAIAQVLAEPTRPYRLIVMPLLSRVVWSAFSVCGRERPRQTSTCDICLRRYFFSTLLSLWNRTLLGKGHGVFGMGAFPGKQHLMRCNCHVCKRCCVMVSSQC